LQPIDSAAVESEVDIIQDDSGPKPFCHMIQLDFHNYDHSFPLRSKAPKGNVKPIDELTKSEEHYYFVYRQVQDGIPFTSAIWPRSTRSEATESSIVAIVGEEGLIEFSANGLFSLGDPLEECAILSPQEAVNVYLEEYTQAIHFENTRITGVELNYVVVKDGESYVARPAWMLTMETDKTTEGTDARPGTPYVEFQTLAVSADTGIILERETDTR